MFPVLLNDIESKLDHFTEGIDTWLEANRLLMRQKVVLTDTIIISAESEAIIDAPLEQWRTEFQEIAIILRETLDLLIYSSLKQDPDLPLKPQDVYFPICASEDEFRIEAQAVTSRLSEAKADLVEAMQPYNNEVNPLTILQAACGDLPLPILMKDDVLSVECGVTVQDAELKLMASINDETIMMAPDEEGILVTFYVHPYIEINGDLHKMSNLAPLLWRSIDSAVSALKNLL